jgi:hypothetical protein
MGEAGGEMEDGVDGSVEIDVLGHVVVDETKPLVSGQVADVADVPGDQVIEPDHLVPFGEEAVGEMAPQEPGGAGDDGSH